MSDSVLENQVLLRNALRFNAVFSVFSGLVILVFNHWLVRFLGLPEQVSLILLAVCLIGYAAMLLFNARKPNLKIGDAWIAVAMDGSWVLGSWVLLLVVPFSAGGKWLIALLAEIVLVFGIIQVLGIRRIIKGRLPTRPA